MDLVIAQCLTPLNIKGTYQKLLVVYLFLAAGIVNMLLIGANFIFMNPLFKCSFTDLQVDESVACPRIKECTITQNFSIVARNHLYCDLQLSRSFIQAMIPLGCVIGVILMNWVGDIKGRRISMLCSHLIAIISILNTAIGGYYGIVQFMAVGQFLSGFAGFAMILNCYIIPYQFCDTIFTQHTIIVINYAWALTISGFGLLYYFYNQWLSFLCNVLLVPTIVSFLLTVFYLIDSPQYLLSHNRYQQCVNSFKRIAYFNLNKCQINAKMQQIKQTMKRFVKKQSVNENQFKILFSNKRYLLLIIIFSCSQTGASLYYFGSNYALDQLGHDYGSNMIATGLIQFAVYILMNLTIEKLPKGKTALLSYLGIVLLSVPLIVNVVGNSVVVTLVVLGLTRFLSTVGYTMVLLLFTSSFQLNVRATAGGLIEAIAQIGSFFAPLIVTFAIDNQINSLFLLAMFSFCLSVIPLFLFVRSQKRRPLPLYSKEGGSDIVQ